MIGKINSSPTFGSKVILKGFGTNNYKNIKMNGYNDIYLETTKNAIRTLKENGENDTVTITYDDCRGFMSVSVEKEMGGHYFTGGPIYFFPNISTVERVYKRAREEMVMDD